MALSSNESKDNGLSEADAGAIYDMLVEHAGATDSYDSRSAFVYGQRYRFTPEYRFIGNLGFGGKFRRSDPGTEERRLGLTESWKVDCYSEDRTPERGIMIDAANAALRELLVVKAGA